MKIQVFGSGCPSCQSLHNTIERIVKEHNVTADIEYITDIARIVELGLMSSPVLVIDDEVIFAGSAPQEKELVQIIIDKK